MSQTRFDFGHEEKMESLPQDPGDLKHTVLIFVQKETANIKKVSQRVQPYEHNPEILLYGAAKSHEVGA
jgi:hypothetical protein